MGILVGLVLFSASVALLMYLRQSKPNENKPQSIAVYVATKHLHRGDYIGASDIIKAKLPKSYVTFTPLVASEIIGRYAKVEIFDKEPIRKEKIATLNPLKISQKKVSPSVIPSQETNITTNVQLISGDTIAIPLSVFKNRDSSLKAGSFVDIISVLPKKSRNNNYEFTTKYIAIHIPVHNFVSKNLATSSYTHSVTTKIKKSVITKAIEADTVVLSMSPKQIKNFLILYYKTQALNDNRVYNTNNYGGQLWMINAASDVDAKVQKVKMSMLLNHKKVLRYHKKRTPKVSISYEK
jgi:Flp pilus assembly protein CpaB